jgi:hypothetical protein
VGQGDQLDEAEHETLATGIGRPLLVVEEIGQDRVQDFEQAAGLGIDDLEVIIEGAFELAHSEIFAREFHGGWPPREKGSFSATTEIVTRGERLLSGTAFGVVLEILDRVFDLLAQLALFEARRSSINPAAAINT